MSDKNINENLENELENPSLEPQNEKKSLIKKLKAARPKKLKNELLFKKGSYSMAITACVLVAVLLVNWLTSALADRFNLEIDMTSAKNNTMSEENIEYVKNVQNEISIIFCADEAGYTDGMMSQYASYYYMVSDSNESSYYSQTINLVKKYADYNKKISLEFMDTQTTEFASVTAKYPTDNIAYGDIIVSSTVTAEDGSQVERHKVISYDDIYTLADDTGYAAMGYGYYTIGGNNIETQLTSAIAFVSSAETKKVAMLTGHATHSYSESYRELLEANNYEVAIVDDVKISELSNEYDVIALVAPNVDFIGSELDVISAFLNNGEDLGKGLIYFADATVPALPNLNAFLSEWGIEVGDAILYETNERNHSEGDPYTLGVYPAEDDITDGMTYCITGYNVPLLAGSPAESDIVVTELMNTLESVVEAPRGSDAGWQDYTEEDLGQYASVIQAEKVSYDIDNNEISSFVMAFSSVEYIYSEWAEYSSLSNKNMVLAATDRAANIGDSGISFVSKTITTESFADAVTAGDVTFIRIFFVILLPIAAVVTGIVVFIRRKNA